MAQRRSLGRGPGLVLGAVLLVACTDTAPTPTPSSSASPTADAAPVAASGDRVAVVVGPAPTVGAREAAALEDAARALADDPPEGVDELRVVVADGDDFAVDLVGLFAGDGYDVVCVVGTGAAELAVEAARLHRGVQVCATDPGVGGGPANVVAAAVDPTAFVSLAGAMTRTVLPPVGLVAGDPVGTVDELEPQLDSLLPEPARPSPSPTPTTSVTPEPSPSPVPPPPAVVTASLEGATATVVSAITEAGAPVAVVLAPGTGAVVEQLAAADVRTVVVDDWVRQPDEELPAGVMTALTVDRGALLRTAIAAARQRGGSQVRLLRLADGVLGVEQGPARGAAAMTARGQEAVDEATAG